MKSNAMAKWFSNGFLVIGLGFIGYAVYGAMQPNSIRLEITDSTATQHRIVGQTRRIPVAAVNKTATRIRLLGTNAC